MRCTVSSIFILCLWIVLKVGLGIALENENTNEGITKIMDYINSYVPHSETDHPTSILSGGDQLTCEWQECIQEGRRQSTKSDRWGVLLHVFEDFHGLGNFYQVFFNMQMMFKVKFTHGLYHATSSGSGQCGCQV